MDIASQSLAFYFLHLPQSDSCKVELGRHNISIYAWVGGVGHKGISCSTLAHPHFYSSSEQLPNVSIISTYLWYGEQFIFCMVFDLIISTRPEIYYTSSYHKTLIKVGSRPSRVRCTVSLKTQWCLFFLSIHLASIVVRLEHWMEERDIEI